MNTRLWTSCLGLLLLATVTACTTQLPSGPAPLRLATPAVGASAPSAGSAFALRVGRTNVWSDGELFDSVVTSASFDPDHGNFDVLYAGCSFQDGVGLISDAKPGDQDYNGGRWEMRAIKDASLCGTYANADSDADLDPADFAPTGNYFECPLLPRRGGGRS